MTGRDISAVIQGDETQCYFQMNLWSIVDFDEGRYLFLVVCMFGAEMDKCPEPYEVLCFVNYRKACQCIGFGRFITKLLLQ